MSLFTIYIVYNLSFLTLLINFKNHTFILEIGAGLAGMGVAFIFLGILLLFDKGLLAIGNVRFI